MVKSHHTTATWIKAVVTQLWTGALLTIPTISFALTFPIPQNGNVVGQIQYAYVQPGDTIADVALRHDMGGYEMLEANPGVSFRNPKPGTRLVVPSRFILPDAPREGVIVNLAEMRIYVYHPDGKHVSTFPAGVGQDGWSTPLGKTTITRKRPNPTWVVPDSIMENHRKHGKIIPKVKPPGPTNPLGKFALSTGLKGIVIHGTPQPKAVGVRSSHGCIRMTNEGVEQVFNLVKVGSPVNFIHQPTKVGLLNNEIFLEAHVPISSDLYDKTAKDLNSLIKKGTNNAQRLRIEWPKVHRMKNKANGIPLPIGHIL